MLCSLSSCCQLGDSHSLIDLPFGFAVPSFQRHYPSLAIVLRTAMPFRRREVVVTVLCTPLASELGEGSGSSVTVPMAMVSTSPSL